MDSETVLKWDVLSDEPPMLDLPTILQESRFNPQLTRTFAKQKRNRNLLLNRQPVRAFRRRESVGSSETIVMAFCGSTHSLTMISFVLVSFA